MRFDVASGSDAVRLRKRLEINQKEFWERVRVTQSGGSRYESGRKLPKTVAICLTIAYGSKKEAIRAIQRLNPTLMNGQAA